MLGHYRNLACVVIGRRVFDMTDGWNGKPAAGEHVFAGMDRGDFRLEVTVDGVTCPFAFAIGPDTTTTLDLGALPCG